jgi:hypothetical protein
VMPNIIEDVKNTLTSRLGTTRPHGKATGENREDFFFAGSPLCTSDPLRADADMVVDDDVFDVRK